MVVCRGGDCGSRRKHPGLDHRRQVHEIRSAGVGEVVVSGCLDACSRSNVVVVLPGEPGRDAGAAEVWLGGVNDPETTGDLLDWVRRGGPGVADPPVLVQLGEFDPSRRNRHELEAELPS